MLDDERDRTVLDRLRREVVPVGVLAGDGEERRAGNDGTRVVGEVPHLNGVGAAEDRLWCKRSNKALELHMRRNATEWRWRRVSASGAISSCDEARTGDLGECRRRDDAAPDRSARLVDLDEHDEARALAGTTPTNEAT